MPEITPSKYLVTAGWDDVPHLSEAAKKELLDSTPPHLRAARSKGEPALGSGAIYPVPWSDVSVKPFEIPAYWPRAFGLDVGWNKTAAIWMAQNPSDLTSYFYAEHYRGEEMPVVHAAAIKARGEWIKGCIDPAARGRMQADGQQLIALYRGNGLKLIPAMNEVEAGLYTCWHDFAIGKLKVFSTLANFRSEYEGYQRDEKGKVIKKDDHLMDAGRYVRMTFDKIKSVQAPDRSGMSMGHAIADTGAGY